MAAHIATSAQAKHAHDRLQWFMACACMPTLVRRNTAPVPVATATIAEILAAKHLYRPRFENNHGLEGR